MPVITIIHTSVDNALKVGVGLEYSRLVSNQAHAGHLLKKGRVACDCLVNGLGIDCRIVVVESDSCIGHLQVCIKAIDFA